MLKPGRYYNPDDYSRGFQGQEKDDEIKGSGNSINYKYRVHDPRLGRFLSIDPLAPDYPHNSPYAFSENRVIDAIELEGLEAYPVNPNNAHATIQQGFANYFGGIAKTVGNWFGGDAKMSVSNSQSITRSTKNRGVTVSRKTTTFQTTTVAFESFFFSYGRDGVSQESSLKYTTVVEGQGKVGPVPVYVSASVDDDDGEVEVKAGVGTNNAGFGPYFNSGGDGDGQAGVSSQVSIPVSSDNSTNNAGGDDSSTETKVEVGFSINLFIDFNDEDD